MTHDLLGNVISDLQARLDRIVITDLRERTFYAHLILQRNGERVEVDSRPSDAIALAVLMKVPIYVEDRVLEDAGAMVPEEPDVEPTGPAEDEPEPEEEGEEGFV